MNESTMASLAALFFIAFKKNCEPATRFSRLLYVSALVLIAQSVEPSSAYAYIDPNTGGYLFQILFPVISMVAAVYLFFKNQVISIFAKFTGLFKKTKDGDS